MPGVRDKIIGILEEIETAPVECDGFCRLASFLLSKNDIRHSFMVGKVVCGDGRAINLHAWIEVEELKVDFRSRMWLGNDAPHGVFKDVDGFEYIGREVEISPISEHIFNLLLMEFPLTNGNLM